MKKHCRGRVINADKKTRRAPYPAAPLRVSRSRAASFSPPPSVAFVARPARENTRTRRRPASPVAGPERSFTVPPGNPPVRRFRFRRPQWKLERVSRYREDTVVLSSKMNKSFFSERIYRFHGFMVFFFNVRLPAFNELPGSVCVSIVGTLDRIFRRYCSLFSGTNGNIDNADAGRFTVANREQQTRTRSTE